ncbi:MAG TPA: DUF5666 domain-containing protein [Candidatus Angelobacter sp.]|nr:DUF5666 domain-containing protein [Candidatus Angelobacter sp.]
MRMGLSAKIATTAATATFLIFVLGWRTPVQTPSAPLEAVTTYHYDNLRTGWNSNEPVLTPANVNSKSFGLLHSVPLDEQVDGQPLLVPGVTITTGPQPGKHDVVYVATENNTIYAIDASSGVVLLTRNFGTPVTMKSCNNNSRNIGIMSTPVIDITAGTMYAMAYSSVGGVPTYILHALDLAGLIDKITPVVVRASHTLSNGTVYSFNAAVSRQRAALLLANGNVYAGFASFCDHNASTTRGWVLGWNAATLSPLANNELTDTQTPPKSSYYLSSVWMSGYGLAADGSGNVYFVTGNSDPNHNVYDGVTNIQESVVKLTPDLSSVSSIFTPADEFGLDQGDTDYGSGGVLLLPPQPGAVPNLAAAAGKEGNLFVLNQQALGGFDPNNKGKVDEVAIDGCWCGQSYFSDGMGRVVSSGGHKVNLWTVQTSPVKLIKAGSQSINSGQDKGFFTSISSSGFTNAIIWAVSRPTSFWDTRVTLYAINATSSSGTLPILFQATAGSWPNLGGNANLVPVVANAHVYVASHKQLSIFGLLNPCVDTDVATSELATQNTLDSGQSEIFGTVTAINGAQFTLQDRNGNPVQADATSAIQNELSISLAVGGAVDVQGTFDANSVLQATVVQRAKDSSDLWPADLLSATQVTPTVSGSSSQMRIRDAQRGKPQK